MSSDKQSAKRWFVSRVTSLSNPKVIETIRENLSPTQLKLFRNTCFGHLLDMQLIDFAPQILHAVLLNIEDRTDPMCFKCKIGDQTLTFGPVEFTLITGLTFGSEPTESFDCIVKNNRVRTIFFGNSPQISLRKLEEVVTSLKNEKNNSTSTERDMDIVRLCLLYVVEGFLLGKEKKYNIDNNYLNLVENLNTFNQWPWGRVSFDRLMKNIHNVIPNAEMKIGSKKNNDKKATVGHYNLLGCPLAIQLWAYEAIPNMGSKFGVITSTDVIPRILRWSSRCNPTLLQCEFIKSSEVVVQNLKPSPLELKSAYYRYFLNTYKTETELEDDPADQIDSQEKVDVPEETVPTSTQERSMFAETIMALRDDVQGIKERVQNMESKFESIHDLLLKLNASKTVLPPTDESSSNSDHNADTTHSDPIILTHSQVPKITTTRYERRLARKTKRAPVLLSPYTDPTKTKKKPRIERAAETAVGTVSSYVELPIKSNDELKSPIATVEDFNTWLSSDSTKLVDLGTIDAGRAWFKKLMTPNAWADGEDIDTVLYMLRLRMKRSPSSFHKCAITDVMFQQTMEGQWTNKKKDGERYKFDGTVLLPYAEGTYPLNSPSWLDVEKLYAPVNYNSKHWVAAEFDFKLMVCKVYDSFQTMTKPNFAVEKLTGMSEILPYLLRAVGIKLKAGAKFKIERVESGVPQQRTEGDCGIFALKCIECLSSGVPLTYSHDDIPAIRNKLALDLYNLKIE